MTLPEKDHTLAETAEVLRISTKTLRKRIKEGADPASGKPFVEHIRRGNKILFTTAQVEALRMADAETAPIVESITTGRKKRSA